jgi:enoyl-CoA hydratase
LSPSRRYDLGTELLTVEVSDGIATVTFDNPARRNALSVGMMTALVAALEQLQRDEDVAVVIMTGAGGKAFVSGADISEFADRRTSIEARREYDQLGGHMWRAWEALEKPVVAMIIGYCLGGGLLTAMQADIRIATPESRFAVPAARLGLGYSFSGVEGLVQLVGPAWTSEILFTGRQLSADEAVGIGLISRVVPAGTIEDVVRGLAASIAGNAPLTVRACKVAIREARRSGPPRNLERVNALVEACFQSADYAEGQRAFLEKRTPTFSGR